jgi:two-component sensor histidine kinase
MEKPLLESLDAARRRNHMLADFGRDALENNNLSELLDQACLRISQAVEVSHSKILEYRPETADLLIVAGHGWREGVVGHVRFRADLSSPPGCALQTGQPVAVDDITNSPGFTPAPVLLEHGIVSLTNVPVPVDGSVWGVLEVDHIHPRHFTPEDTDFLYAFARFLGFAIQRKRTDMEKDRLTAAQAAAAAQTEILLRELQHRMKNNLQIVLSLISTQKRKTANVESRNVLDHIAGRVTAISLAQDQLSTSQQLRIVNLGAYLRALCAYIDTGRDEITIEVKAEDIDISVDQAVPVGLIVNEALTNATKYAFPDGRRGRVLIRFDADVPTRMGMLLIADDGVGIAAPRDNGSGLALTEQLAFQLGGALELDSAPGKGTTIRVSFPLHP